MWWKRTKGKTHSPEVVHGAYGLKPNPTVVGHIHKQVRHGLGVVVGAGAGHTVCH